MKKSSLIVLAAIPLVVVGSVAVWQLSDRERRVGAITATSDPVALAWRGPWSSDAKYRSGQVVSWEGSSYVADQDVFGTKPGCSGAGCPWWPMASGTSGQSMSTDLGSDDVTVSNESSDVPLPGLTRSVTVPEGALVYVAAHGGVDTTAGAGGYSMVDVGLFVDGAADPAPGFKVRSVAVHLPEALGQDSWGMSGSLSLPAGTHTVALKAKLRAGAPARVSDAGISVNRGVLTVMVLKR